MELVYCDKWSITGKKPWNIIDSKKAQECHNNKISYSVLIKERGRITHVIEVGNKFIAVDFMTDFLKPYLCYIFDVKDNNKLFLKSAYFTEHDNKTKESLIKIFFRFTENGYTVMERINIQTGESEERESQGEVDSNWDIFPDFGKYERILKKDR